MRIDGSIEVSDGDDDRVFSADQFIAAMEGGTGPLLNVKQSPYNANGTGASDDTAAIQAAINTAVTSGGTVYLPAGTYTITSTLLIPEDSNSLFVSFGGAVMQGAGRQSTVIQCADGMSSDMVTCLAENWHFRDFTLKGRSSTQTSGRGLVYTKLKVNLSNMMIYDTYSDGVVVDGGSSQWHDVIVYACKAYGVHVTAVDTQMTNVFIATNSLTGLKLDTGSGAGLYTNVHSFSNGQTATSDGHGMIIVAGNNNQFTTCYFEDNGNSSSGLAANSPSGVRDQTKANRYVNCYFWNNAGQGLISSGGTHGSLVSCLVQNNGQKNNSAGIALFNTTNWRVIGCIGYDDGGTKHQTFGLSVTGTQSGTIILGNSFKAADHTTGNIQLTATGTYQIGFNSDYITANGGSSTQTPGVVTTFAIAHGLSAAPTKFSATAGDTNARGAPAYHLSADATNVTLNFASALTTSTAYTYVWRAEV